MLQIEARVVGRARLSGGDELVTLQAPELASRAKPGQILAVRGGDSSFDPLPRYAVPLAGADTPMGTITILLAGGASLAGQRGEMLDLLGPIGRGWRLDEQTRNVVLIGAEADLGALLFMAAVATRRSCNVSLLVGTEEGRPARLGALVPAAVEYQLARGASPAAAALDLLDRSLLSWADALYTTLPVDTYPLLGAAIRAARIRWQAAFAQGLLLPPMACFCGICDTCLVPEARRSPWRACTDGPQCDVRDFVR